MRTSDIAAIYGEFQAGEVIREINRIVGRAYVVRVDINRGLNRDNIINKTFTE